MGETRIVGPGETRGYPYLGCKKKIVSRGETGGYPYSVCKNRFVGGGETHGYPYLVFKKELSVQVTFRMVRKIFQHQLKQGKFLPRIWKLMFSSIYF